MIFFLPLLLVSMYRGRWGRPPRQGTVRAFRRTRPCPLVLRNFVSARPTVRSPKA